MATKFQGCAWCTGPRTEVNQRTFRDLTVRVCQEPSASDWRSSHRGCLWNKETMVTLRQHPYLWGFRFIPTAAGMLESCPHSIPVETPRGVNVLPAERPCD